MATKRNIPTLAAERDLLVADFCIDQEFTRTSAAELYHYLRKQYLTSDRRLNVVQKASRMGIELKVPAALKPVEGLEETTPPPTNTVENRKTRREKARADGDKRGKRKGKGVQEEEKPNFADEVRAALSEAHAGYDKTSLAENVGRPVISIQPTAYRGLKRPDRGGFICSADIILSVAYGIEVATYDPDDADCPILARTSSGVLDFDAYIVSTVKDFYDDDLDGFVNFIGREGPIVFTGYGGETREKPEVGEAFIDFRKAVSKYIWALTEWKVLKGE